MNNNQPFIKIEDGFQTQRIITQTIGAVNSFKSNYFQDDNFPTNLSIEQHNHPWMFKTGMCNSQFELYNLMNFNRYFPGQANNNLYNEDSRLFSNQRNMFSSSEIYPSMPFQEDPYLQYLKRYPFLSQIYQQRPKEDKVMMRNFLKEESKVIKVKLEEGVKKEKNQQSFNVKSKHRNQTKNIPKNYGKAMISFILEHSDWIKLRYGINIHNQLIDQLKYRKNRINSIVHLKELWTHSKYSKEFRVLSNLFLRKHSFGYIFNSRVSNYTTHIKYKYKLQDALKSPESFKNIKQY